LEHPDILACKGLKKVIQEKTCLCEQQWTGSGQVRFEGCY
jgi:hypothetical protein